MHTSGYIRYNRGYPLETRRFHHYINSKIKEKICNSKANQFRNILNLYKTTCEVNEHETYSL